MSNVHKIYHSMFCHFLKLKKIWIFPWVWYLNNVIVGILTKVIVHIFAKWKKKCSMVKKKKKKKYVEEHHRLFIIPSCLMKFSILITNHTTMNKSTRRHLSSPMNLACLFENTKLPFFCNTIVNRPNTNWNLYNQICPRFASKQWRGVSFYKTRSSMHT